MESSPIVHLLMEKFISSWSLVAELKVFGLIHVDVQQRMQISGQLSCAQSLEDFRFCTGECDLTITWSLKMIFLTVVACEIGRNSYFAGMDWVRCLVGIMGNLLYK